MKLLHDTTLANARNILREGRLRPNYGGGTEREYSITSGPFFHVYGEKIWEKANNEAAMQIRLAFHCLLPTISVERAADPYHADIVNGNLERYKGFAIREIHPSVSSLTTQVRIIPVMVDCLRFSGYEMLGGHMCSPFACIAFAWHRKRETLITIE